MDLFDKISTKDPQPPLSIDITHKSRLFARPVLTLSPCPRRKSWFAILIERKQKPASVLLDGFSPEA